MSAPPESSAPPSSAPPCFVVLPFCSSSSDRFSLTGWGHSLNPRTECSIKLVSDPEFSTAFDSPSSSSSINCVELFSHATTSSNHDEDCEFFYPSQASPPLHCPFPVINFHLYRYPNRFVSFRFEVTSSTGSSIQLHFSTRLSTVQITESSITAPLVLDDGWNILSINVQDYLLNILNLSFQSLNRIRLFASCKVRAVFITQNELNHWELPEIIRLSLKQTNEKEKQQEEKSQEYSTRL
jgi:hypothetical protein